MVPRVTIAELVRAVAEFAQTDAEVAATVAHMVNTGSVRLRGKFAGARIDLGNTQLLQPVLVVSRGVAA
ncbi:MAG TPA: hypothetical protein VEI94_13470 [Candidatus Bathyarchaeia archaeon]|nr:hypothetical protein [Candidatus Bathyarchaeia archaeon]